MLKLDTFPTNTKQHISNKTIKISKIFKLTSVPLHKTLKTDSTLNGFYRIFFQTNTKKRDAIQRVPKWNANVLTLNTKMHQ